VIEILGLAAYAAFALCTIWTYREFTRQYLVAMNIVAPELKIKKFQKTIGIPRSIRDNPNAKEIYVKYRRIYWIITTIFVVLLPLFMACGAIFFLSISSKP